jgi:hypothetical protein
VSFMLSVIYAECHLCWVSFTLSDIYVEWHLCWVTFMLSVIYAECHLCWVSFMLSVMYAECHVRWVSFTLSDIHAEWHSRWVTFTLSDIHVEWHSRWVTFTSLMPSVIYKPYAECHLCWVSFMLSVTYAECHFNPFLLSVNYAECHIQALYNECHYSQCRRPHHHHATTKPCSFLSSPLSSTRRRYIFVAPWHVVSLNSGFVLNWFLVRNFLLTKFNKSFKDLARGHTKIHFKIVWLHFGKFCYILENIWRILESFGNFKYVQVILVKFGDFLKGYKSNLQYIIRKLSNFCVLICKFLITKIQLIFRTCTILGQ